MTLKKTQGIREMKNKIKELENQCYGYAGFRDDTIVFDKQKFAELIVKECAKFVNDIEYPYEDTSHKDTWDACCVWSAEKLKNYFGVKE